MKVTCPRCEGMGEWDEGPLPARAPQIDPEYIQVICPECGGERVVDDANDGEPE